jgi:putative transposase
MLLAEKLKSLHQESRGTYGAPRLTEQLKTHGYKCGRKRVASLMRKAGIIGCARKRFRPMGTTYPKHNLPIAPRLFEIEKKENLPQAPNRVWVGDTTYIPTKEGWIFLTIVMDLFSRKVVGYSITDHLRAEATWEAMRRGICSQTGALSPQEPNLLVHSDQGTQYASDLYRGKLKLLGITQSMSRKGNCYDNAYAESFFHTLKIELVHRYEFQTRTQAQNAIQEYIDCWYNVKRLHSGLGYKTPFEYERNALAA